MSFHLVRASHGTLRLARFCWCLFAVVQVNNAYGDWNSFQNGGQPSQAQALPTTWAVDQNIAWQVDLPGYGQSTPVISEGLVVVTTTSGDNKENYQLAAYQLSDGQLAWSREFPNPSPEKNTPYVSRAAPTAVADRDGFIAFFEGGLLAAVDHQGELRWSRDLVDEFGAISARHGLASSLEQDDSHVFVWVERQESPYLLAVAKSSGETGWKVPGLGSTTWSSPRLVPVGEGAHLVCSANGKIAGFDPATGKQLWAFDEISNNTSCTPIPVGNGQFIIGASDGRGEENAGKGASSNGLIAIKEIPSGGWSADFVWRAKKATCSFGSPSVANDSVFFVNRVGVLFELDVATGEQKATRRIKSGSVWATPMANGDQLYLFGQKGTTTILDLSSGKSISDNALWETVAAEGERSMGGDVLYAGAAAAPYLVLRRGNTLFAIREE